MKKKIKEKITKKRAKIVGHCDWWDFVCCQRGHDFIARIKNKEILFESQKDYLRFKTLLIVKERNPYGMMNKQANKWDKVFYDKYKKKGWSFVAGYETFSIFKKTILTHTLN